MEPIPKTTFEGWSYFISRILDNIDLSEDESEAIMSQILVGQAKDSQIAAFLIALKSKGETIHELMGLVKAMLNAAEKIEIDYNETLLDTCGTGGDRSGTFNISTTSSIVVAASGVKVAKHGNRAASSNSGSADVLEALGVAIDLGPDGVKKCLDEVGIGFFLAQKFHPAMRFVGPVRKELGIPTVFNLLGPLSNPARPAFHLLGVSNINVANHMRQVLMEMGCKKALIVHSKEGLDEISTVSPTFVFQSEVQIGENGERLVKETNFEIDPSDYGFKSAKMEDLLGGSPKDNAEIVRSILNGEKGPKRDVVLINAGAAIYAANRAESIEIGIDLAKESIDNGNALEVLDRLVKVSNEAKVSE